MRGGGTLGFVAAAAAVLLAGARPARAAVADYLGKPVASVRVLVEGRESTDPAVTQIVETRVGAPLSMAQVRDSVTRLFSLGRFEDVRVDATLENGRVALRFDLSPIHPVTKVAFTGPLKRSGVDVGALRRAIADRYGSTPAVGRAADMARTLEEVLNAAAFLHPHITPHADLAHDPDRATLVFDVDPGARTTIGSIDVAGTPSVPTPALLKALGLATGMPYEREALAARTAKYIDDRRRHGYYEAKATASARFDDGDRVVHLTIAVDHGPHVRVVFAGDPLPADKRADLVPVEREGTADEDLLEDSSNRIEEYLRSLGYRDAAAPHTREASSGELLVTFTVRKGRRYRLAQVEVSGNASLPLAQFADALREHAGDPFAEGKVDADVSTIEAIYHRGGFPLARAQSAVSVGEAADGGDVPVTVRIAITEGARTIVGSITITGNDSVPEAQLRAHVRLQPGAPYFDAQLAADRSALAQTYQDLGYESASVDAAANYSVDRTRADPTFTVREGPRIFIDRVLIVGNVRTSASTIEHALNLKNGDPLSASAVSDAQTRLATLGLFRRTTINELRHGGENRRDLLVTVEEAPATTIGYGGGFEAQQVVRTDASGIATTSLEFAPRASFELGRRNLFGKNRSLNFFASVAEHLNGLPTEYQLLATYREPRFYDSAADAFVTATIQQVHRTSFDYSQKSATAAVARHLTRALSASVNYQIQKTNVFDDVLTGADQLLIDRLFANVLLSSFSGSVIHDTRSDPVEPHSGSYASGNAQVAGRRIGSAVGFAKSFFTVETFRQIPGTRGIVFAGDARLGLATGFPQVDPAGAIVRDLPQSERFYAGGDTTVRGFALDTLGVHHTPARAGDTIDQNGFPTGGNGLVILNAELRAPVWGGLGAVGFVDAGNVFQRATDLDLGLLRTAVGFGIRYKSPIGPLRIDLGFKLHREVITLLPFQREGLTALHISLGQAF